MGFSVFDITDITADYELLDDTTNDIPNQVFGDGTRRAILQSIIVTTDDPVDVVLGAWGMYAGTPNTLLGTIVVPGQSGFLGGGPAVDLVPLLFPLTGSFIVAPQYGLGLALINSLSAGKFAWTTTIGGLF